MDPLVQAFHCSIEDLSFFLSFILEMMKWNLLKYPWSRTNVDCRWVFANFTKYCNIQSENGPEKCLKDENAVKIFRHTHARTYEHTRRLAQLVKFNDRTCKLLTTRSSRASTATDKIRQQNTHEALIKLLYMKWLWQLFWFHRAQNEYCKSRGSTNMFRFNGAYADCFLTIRLKSLKWHSI